MKIIFAGVIAREPLGGPAWVWLQYLLGFQRLGHEVYFLEESGEWPYVYDYSAMEAIDDPERGAKIIDRFLAPFRLGNSWVYRVGDRCLGMDRAQFESVCRSADLMIVLPTSVWTWRPEYDAIPARVFLDVDPGFTQLRAAEGDDLICRALDRCTHFLTYGPAIACDDSPVPRLGLPWHATRPPVVLDWWPSATGGGGNAFRTLMHWSNDPSPAFNGETYGQKSQEFERIVDLPGRTSQALEVALTGGPAERLRDRGWQVVPGWQASEDPAAYQRYIQGARAEFSVAKQGYVRTGCGWISDRTVCFLASGKPALVQDTGLQRWLPIGEGLLTFRDVEEAAVGIDVINSDYPRHRRAARQLAKEYFDSNTVLDDVLRHAMVDRGSAMIAPFPMCPATPGRG